MLAWRWCCDDAIFYRIRDAKYGLWRGGTATVNDLLLDASGEKAALCFQPMLAGDVTKIIWCTGTVTTGNTVDVRLETMSGADPSGSLLAANTNGSQVVGSGDDVVWFETALTSAATVTPDMLLAVVITVPASTNLNIRCVNNSNSGSGTGLFPRGRHYTTSWGTTSNNPSIFLEYSDGRRVPASGSFIPHITATTLAVSTSTTPDEVGNLFIPTIASRIAGVQVYIAQTTGTFDVILYSSANAVLASFSTTNTNIVSGSALRLFFSSSYDVVAGDTYRLVLKPTNTTNTSTIYYTTKDNIDLTAAGDDYYMTERTDAGSWTETTTRVCGIFPIFGGFDDGAGPGGGMLVHPGMTGGMNG